MILLYSRPPHLVNFPSSGRRVHLIGASMMPLHEAHVRGGVNSPVYVPARGGGSGSILAVLTLPRARRSIVSLWCLFDAHCYSIEINRCGWSDEGLITMGVNEKGTEMNKAGVGGATCDNCGRKYKVKREGQVFCCRACEFECYGIKDDTTGDEIDLDELGEVGPLTVL